MTDFLDSIGYGAVDPARAGPAAARRRGPGPAGRRAPAKRTALVVTTLEFVLSARASGGRSIPATAACSWSPARPGSPAGASATGWDRRHLAGHGAAHHACSCRSACWRAGTTSPSGSAASTRCMLTLLTGLVGVFIALDLFLFYVFFEVMLIPMYFIIGIWGGANRLYAAIKFFIYTMAGSLLMLVAIVVLVWKVPGGHRHAVVRLRAPAGSNAGAAGAAGALALRRLRPRLRDQGADLPVPHLAARRPRRGADRGQRAAGRRHAQDRHLRLPPLRGAVLPRRWRFSPGGQPT